MSRRRQSSGITPSEEGARPTRLAPAKPRRRFEPSLEGMGMGIIGGIAGLVVAMMVFPMQPAPGHWVFAALVGLLAFMGGELFHHYREPF